MNAAREASESSTCIGRLCRALWQLAFVGLLIAALGVLGWRYAEGRIDGEIRDMVEQRLREELGGPTTEVSVASARRVDGKGIELRGVSIGSPDGRPYRLEIPEIWIVCPCEVQQLINNQVDIRHITLRRPRLILTRDADGDWPFDAFKAPSGGNSPTPTIVIEDGTVEFCTLDGGRSSGGESSGDADSGTSRPLVLRGIQLDLKPATKQVLEELGWGRAPGAHAPPAATHVAHANAAADHSGASHETDTKNQSGASVATGASREIGTDSKTGSGDKRNSNAVGQQVLHVRVATTAEHFDTFRLESLWDTKRREWLVRGAAHGVRLSREWIDLLPDAWAEKVIPFELLQARGEIGFELASPDKPGGPIRFLVGGDVTQGRLEDPRLPTPVTELCAKFVLSNDGAEVSQLSARCGSASVEAILRTAGWRAEGPLRMDARIRGFELTRHWVDFLSPDLRAKWDVFAPLGAFDADVTIDYDGRQWRPEFTIDARDLSLAYNRFPYRFTDGRGRVHLKGGRLTSQELVIHAQGRPIHVELDLRDPGRDFTGLATFRSSAEIAIDKDLLAALDGPVAQVVKSLQPRGDFLINGRIERQDPAGPVRRRIELDFKDASLRYDAFPYPIEKIRGQLIVQDNGWELRETVGRNDSAYIVGRGKWTQSSADAGSMQLDFEATDVPLEDDLRSALPAGAQRLWTSLQPRGTIDYLNVSVRYPNASGKAGIEVVAQKRPPSQNVVGRNLTLRPPAVPYPFDNVVGTVRYRNGRVELESIKAEHGRTTFHAGGICLIDAAGNWHAQLNKIYADRLLLDHDLLAALPAGARQAVSRLDWSGPLNIEGALDLRGSAHAGDPVRTGWDVRVDVDNGRLNCGYPIEQIQGAVRFTGSWDGRDARSRGELEIDSAFCHGIQVTQIRGPLVITPTQVVIGDFWAENRVSDRPPRPVTARLFGGTTTTDAVLVFGEDMGFRVQAAVQDADLQLIARQALPNQQNIFGKAFASVQLEGSSRGPHTWRGQGKIFCRDADIYDLPVMAATLKPLSVRRPDLPAFSLSDVDFRVVGDRVYFDRIDLKGDAVTLKGQGEMTFNRIVDLQFYTLVGRDDVMLPVVSSLLSEASRQILEVRVTGPVESPTVNRKVVPVINEALQQMFPEIAARSVERPLMNRVPLPRQLIPRVQP